jgi:replicative DNA helicase
MAKKIESKRNTKPNYDVEKLKTSTKQPPNAVEVEMAVLGAMMIDEEAVPKAVEILKPDSFYDPKHAIIFSAISSLYESGEPIDTVSVYEELKKEGKVDLAGGAAYISKLTQDIASAANIDYHSRVVMEKWILRKLISSSMEIASLAYEGQTDVFDLLDAAEAKIFQISEEGIKESFTSMEKAVKEAWELIEAIHAKKISTHSVPTGFAELDDLLGGFQRSDLIIIAARPAMGKCLGKGTKVLMFDGSIKKVEDVKVGDLLMGNDSKPRKVLSIARGKEMMYWVRQNYGIDYRVNESHILSLKRSRNQGKYVKGEVLNIELSEYLTKSDKWKSNYKGYKTSVEFKHKNTPIDPYFLGLWLGDGKSDGSSIYTQDKEVVDYIYSYAKELGATVTVLKDKEKCPAYIITNGKSQVARNSSLQAKLRNLGLLNNKHIPQIYLVNDKKTRLSLLAGLIDSDGFINHNFGGTIEITTKYEILANQIKFLCDTLGYRTSLKSKKAKISSSGFESTVWRVRFNGNVDEIPTRIKRKKAKKWIANRDWQVNGIKVEKDKVDDYYGFVLDGNHLFLLEDCTVTHNTAFAMSAARNAAMEYNVPIGVFSLEMATNQLVTRLISAESRINAHSLRTGKFKAEDGAKVSRIIHKLMKAPIYIDDTPGISILELRAKARRLKNEKKIGLLIVDYLQLVNPSFNLDSREREISTISRSLKALAKELNIPVIALSQLNRQVETRSDKRPQLSDLRESGSIEQDADVVIFLNRPEVYGITQFSGSDDMKGESTEGIAEVIIGKQRNGPIGEVKLKFIKEYARFENLERFRVLPESIEPQQIEESPF